MDDVTGETLRLWRDQHGITQSKLGHEVGLDKVAISKIESGSRRISPAEQRLLQLRMYGRLPFGTNPADTQLSFSTREWILIDKLSHREGFASPKDWVVHKIRAYLSMLPDSETEETFPVAAEPQEPARQFRKGGPAANQADTAALEALRSEFPENSIIPYSRFRAIIQAHPEANRETVQILILDGGRSLDFDA